MTNEQIKTKLQQLVNAIDAGDEASGKEAAIALAENLMTNIADIAFCSREILAYIQSRVHT